MHKNTADSSLQDLHYIAIAADCWDIILGVEAQGKEEGT